MSFHETVMTEAFERTVRKAAENGLKASAAEGKTGNRGAKSVLGRLIDPQGELVQQYKGVIGFSAPLLGSGVAGIVKKPEFWDGLLPGEQNSVINFLKLVLRTAAPAILVGGSNAYSDAVINRAVDSQISDPLTTDPAARNKPLDRLLVVTRLLDGQFFFPEYYPDGRIKEFDGIPAVADPDFRRVMNAWKAATTQPPPWGYISTAMAAEMVATTGTASADKVAALTELIKASSATTAPAAAKAGFAALTHATKRVIRAFTSTMSHFGIFEYDQAEDLAKDLFQPGFDPDVVNELGQFEDLIVPGRKPHFSLEDYGDVETHIDVVLGGERTRVNQMRRLIRQFRFKRASEGLQKAKSWLWATAKWFIFLIAVFFLVFVVSAAAFTYGVFGSTLSGSAGVLESVRFLIWGAIGLLVTTYIATVTDAPLNLAGGLLGLRENAMTRIAQLLAFGIGLLTILIVPTTLWSLELAGAAYWRYNILAAIICGYGMVMGAKSAGFYGQASLWTLDTATMGRKLGFSVIVFALIGAFLSAFGLNPFSRIGKIWNSLESHINMSPLLAASIAFVVVGLTSLFVLHFIEKKRGFENGGMVKLAAFAFAVVVAYGVYDSAKPAEPAPKPKAEVVVTPTPVVRETVVNRSLLTVNAPVRTVVQPRRVPSARSNPCSDPTLTYDMRQDLNCSAR